MVEITVKANIPNGLSKKFEKALSELVKQFEEEEAISISIELGREFNKSLHKRYKEHYPNLE